MSRNKKLNAHIYSRIENSIGSNCAIKAEMRWRETESLQQQKKQPASSHRAHKYTTRIYTHGQFSRLLNICQRMEIFLIHSAASLYAKTANTKLYRKFIIYTHKYTFCCCCCFVSLCSRFRATHFSLALYIFSVRLHHSARQLKITAEPTKQLNVKWKKWLVYKPCISLCSYTKQRIIQKIGWPSFARSLALLYTLKAYTHNKNELK